ncbi:MAG: bifunctional hydroxymethylpyrimidine kinase/phosphomethylpyrimidine kinase [Betaproteobacteria bacterium]|nr:bifunctional hydroxymethylpyrimidine kinase/phosphomethylpyrimidine kinase [Betaproteobacteria bacterium]
MFLNAADPSGAAGLSADQAVCAAVGCHALPVTTSIWVCDTAEVFDIVEIDADAVVEQARAVLQDVELAAWKVGFLGGVEVVSAVAELLADYSQIPLVTYVGNLQALEESQVEEYIKAMQELILPQTRLLCGNVTALSQFLFPDVEREQPPTPDALMQQAHALGVQYLLVSGVLVPENHVENVLLSPRRQLLRERFELIESGFSGAGDTLSAAVASLLGTGAKLDQAVHEALEFLDQSLDFAYRPGMGNMVPDRFFWAQTGPEGEGDSISPVGLQ